MACEAAKLEREANDEGHRETKEAVQVAVDILHELILINTTDKIDPDHFVVDRVPHIRTVYGSVTPSWIRWMSTSSPSGSSLSSSKKKRKL